MGWTVRGSNPGGGGGEFFRTCLDQPRGPPSLLYKGYQVFSGGKEQPGRDADPSPPSGAMAGIVPAISFEANLVRMNFLESQTTKLAISHSGACERFSNVLC